MTYITLNGSEEKTENNTIAYIALKRYNIKVNEINSSGQGVILKVKKAFKYRICGM